MQTFEVEAEVKEDHFIHIQLPEDWDINMVKVTVSQTEIKSKLLSDTKNQREFGQFKGQIHMTDDFDDELADSFWLGDKK